MGTIRSIRESKQKMQRLTLLALLSAVVAVLAYFGGFIKIGGLASISLTLIPVVLGAALCGPMAGAWLGAVAAAVFFITPDAAFWLGLDPAGTIVTVLVKGVAAGFLAGLVYQLFAWVNRYFAVLVAAVVCPLANTGIFLLGCRLFFWDTVTSWAVAEGISTGAYLILFFVGLNFVFELAVNVLLSPAVLRLINMKKKN